ncbi:hypothetical protein ACTMTI_05545 [Nonomuraea sp. H19]|uniref:hypothetical protein n=1 Tax=Nonomuraea sp. H19 TaxID=3452206 RepID=UPI003F8B63AC
MPLVAQGEEQLLTQRVGERRELLRRANLQNILRRWQLGRLITHTEGVYTSLTFS